MKKGQSLKPIEYLIPVAIVAIGFLLILFWVNLQNDAFEQRVRVSQATLGGATILSDALDAQILNQTMADRIRNDVAQWTDRDVTSGPFAQYANLGGGHIELYLKRHYSWLPYQLYVDGRQVAHSQNEPQDPVSITLMVPSAQPRKIINITMVYAK
jgi:hypothetical protein